MKTNTCWLLMKQPETDIWVSIMWTILRARISHARYYVILLFTTAPCDSWSFRGIQCIAPDSVVVMPWSVHSCWAHYRITFLVSVFKVTIWPGKWAYSSACDNWQTYFHSESCLKRGLFCLRRFHLARTINLSCSEDFTIWELVLFYNHGNFVSVSQLLKILNSILSIFQYFSGNEYLLLAFKSISVSIVPHYGCCNNMNKNIFLSLTLIQF